MVAEAVVTTHAQRARLPSRVMLDAQRAIAAVYMQIDGFWLEEVLRNLRSYPDPQVGISMARTPPFLGPQLEKAFAASYEQAWENTGLVVQSAIRRAGKRLWQPGTIAIHSAEGDATDWLLDYETTVGLVVPEQAIYDYAQTRVPPLVRVYGRQRKRWASGIVSTVAQEGGTLTEMAARLEVQFPKFSSYRRMNIARTESSTLYNHGSIDRYRASGSVVGSRILNPDPQTDICQWHAGREYKLDDPSLPVCPLHFSCKSINQPILFNERPDWQVEPAPEGKTPMRGFGHYRSPVPNVSTQEMLSKAWGDLPAETGDLLRGLVQ